MVFRLEVSAKRLQIFTVKVTVLRNIHDCLGLGQILRWENNIKIDHQEVERRDGHELDRSGSE